ncbi:MAG: glycosyltransferase family 2 protein [Dehalococcoidia bacterium]|nr:glycosyltransferase family 2 protein [Dehalococcoidia bacterium]
MSGPHGSNEAGTEGAGARYTATYLLPIRRTHIEADDDLDAYLAWLASLAPGLEVIVVDGSPPEVFDHHHARWAAHVAHIAPLGVLRGANGKAWGVNTGLRYASHERVVIADDDVRHDEGSLTRLVALLDHAEVVRPQNYFHPLPWHALWDTGRILLNRTLGGDWPGTLALRRHTPAGERIEGYDGGVLFENLELCRTVEAAGGRHLVAPDLYVRRKPPTARHFWSQRVRQAYDEFARPPVLLAELAVAPAVAAVLLARRPGSLLAGALGVVALAEVGRRRAGGARYFPPHASVMAPVWVLERAACSWIALWWRVRHGGIRYGDQVLTKAANSTADLRRQRLDGAIPHST